MTDRVKAWAHSNAQRHNFNPWSPSDDSDEASFKDKSPSQNGEPAKEDKPKRSRLGRVFANVKVALFHSWVNVLLVFVPVGIAVHFAGVNENVVVSRSPISCHTLVLTSLQFALNAVAIIPLAGLLTFATECVAHRLGPTLGALLNVSFGNAVELIILYAPPKILLFTRPTNSLQHVRVHLVPEIGYS